MAEFCRRWQWPLGGTVTLTLLLAVLAWIARDRLAAWYKVQRLIRSTSAERDYWMEQVARDPGSVAELFNCLAKPDRGTCDKAATALARIVEGWEVGDPRRAGVVHQLAKRFAQLSCAGQERILQLEAAWVSAGETNKIADLLKNSYHCLQLGARSSDPEVRLRSLQLAASFLARESPPEASASCRDLLRLGLQDADAANRALAARLTCLCAVSLLPQVAPLLDDPAPQVRKAAMLAVGPAAEAITTDDLLRSLHDSDGDVRILCEKALKSRGLTNEDLLLGKLISDPGAHVRLQILNKLERMDREPGVWLRRLSHDPSPAVRAAALAAAADHPQVDLAGRIQQMATHDPSPTVRQLAQHFLVRHGSRQLQETSR